MEKTSFVQKCIAKLNLTEDSKIELAAKQIITTLEKEIKVRERKITDLKAAQEEVLTDLNEQLTELIAEKKDIAITIDTEAVVSNESRRSYVKVYVAKLQKAIDLVKTKEVQIEDYKKEVSDRIKEQQDQIDTFKSLLKEMV